MAFENVSNLLTKPKYLLIWLVTTVVIGWLYIGPLTNQSAYNTLGWIFAIVFPILSGGIVAGQVYNLSESKTCPATATTSGVLGWLAGVITVGCPMCPAILLGWIGLGTALPSALLGGPWLKLISLVLLVLGLYWATSKK